MLKSIFKFYVGQLLEFTVFQTKNLSKKGLTENLVDLLAAHFVLGIENITC